MELQPLCVDGLKLTPWGECLLAGSPGYRRTGTSLRHLLPTICVRSLAPPPGCVLTHDKKQQ